MNLAQREMVFQYQAKTRGERVYNMSLDPELLKAFDEAVRDILRDAWEQWVVKSVKAKDALDWL